MMGAMYAAQFGQYADAVSDMMDLRQRGQTI
jgi:hypothetical protein